MSVIPKSGDQKYAFQEEQDRQKSDSERVANKRGQSHSKNFDNDNNLSNFCQGFSEIYSYSPLIRTVILFYQYIAYTIIHGHLAKIKNLPLDEKSPSHYSPS